MIRGLEIRMPSEELASRIAERVQVHETEKMALDERIGRREGDMPYDVRVGDGLETLGELQSRRAFHAERATQLNLIRAHLIVDETYTLNLVDLRGADLVVADVGGGEGAHADLVWESRRPALSSASETRAIEGLTLSMTGVELQVLLKDRMRTHRDAARRWKREESRTSEDETEDQPLLPSHICENEAERHEWRAEVLGFIHDHIEPTEMYRLGEADLAFGELLPAKPGWLEQDEYEERTAVGFQLARLVKSGGFPSSNS